MTIELADWLMTGAAQQRLDSLAERDLGERALLAVLNELRAEYTPDQAAALIDQARLRRRGRAKFGERAQQMLFVDEALEQASGQPIARYRAARYAPFDYVADLGCGIGGDTLALSERCDRLLALEIDPIRLRLARHNLGAVGGQAVVAFEACDWTTSDFPADVEALFADPARRTGGRRRFSLGELEPPFEALRAVQKQIPNIGVKVMPGIPDGEVPADCEIEFISEGGICKEGVLWFGRLRRGVARSATIVHGSPDSQPAGETLGSDQPAPPVAVTAPRAYLWEPDPAVIRATVVTQLAHRLGATQIDEQIAYLTSDEVHDTPFARVWPVLEHVPFNLKTLNRRLRALDAQVITVKKRGSPIEPETFRKRLKSRPDGRPVTLFITRVQDQPWMILCGPERRRAD